MTTIGDLQPLVEEPMERLEVEYKDWLEGGPRSWPKPLSHWPTMEADT